ncbi:hypothetical protein [Vibrio sp. 99-70-13A1]|uniref:hypothetical protein n=1 Tax=Vibrio sp. 99-70-13A1 TaxID=2607601 RepID=UPI0014935638|nr:hypothetical protein [Vibrio sp. 99-70-13A1]NOH97731.1 hypothetical protein [Vibrio sp. 99-70-13A1]
MKSSLLQAFFSVNSRCLSLLLLCFSSSLPAAEIEPWWLRHVFNTAQALPEANSLLNEVGLFDCGEEEATLLCSDEIKYYNEKVYVELELTDTKQTGKTDEITVTEEKLSTKFVSVVRFNTIFNAHTYTMLQANLRRDGFVIQSIVIGNEVFDVVKELAAAKQQNESPQSVDTKLITFMNQRRLVSDQASTWMTGKDSSPKVRLLREGSTLTLELFREAL